MSSWKARVAYEWEAVDPSEMTITPGQVLDIQEVNDKGWALAVDPVTGTSGWVPHDYLEVMDEGEEEIIEVNDNAQIQQAMQSLNIAVQEPVQQQAQTVLAPQNNASGPTCASCQQTIVGQSLVAKGNNFHPDCFVCLTCRKPLTGGFLEKDGQYYCEQDYYKSQGNVCAHCNQVIIGGHILGNGKPYHVDHLLCSVCNVSIGTNVLHVKDDQNVCHDCYNSQFATLCDKCHKPIEYQVFSALDKNYHQECFVCAEGDHPMPNEAFHLHEDKIYCPMHYQKIFAKQCHQCKQDITGQYLQVLDFYFHSQCWTCNKCNTLLEQTGCAKKNDQFYCPACVVTIPTQLAPQAAAPAKPAPSKAAAPAPAAPAPKTTAAPAAPTPKTTAAPAPAPAPAQRQSVSGGKGELYQTLHKDDNNGSGSDMSLEEMRRRLQEVSAKALEQANKSTEVELFELKDFYPLAELMQKARLPPSIDRQHLELYLSDEEFQATFKMNKEAFKALKTWKQNELKKGAQIF